MINVVLLFAQVKIILLSDVEGSSACENSSMVYINKLQELPLTICHINRKVLKSNCCPYFTIPTVSVFYYS